MSENVYAGTAMLRRGVYHAGTSLPISATGALGTGDPKIFATIAGLTDQPDPAFAIVTP